MVYIILKDKLHGINRMILSVNMKKIKNLYVEMKLFEIMRECIYIMTFICITKYGIIMEYKLRYMI